MGDPIEFFVRSKQEPSNLDYPHPGVVSFLAYHSAVPILHEKKKIKTNQELFDQIYLSESKQVSICPSWPGRPSSI